MDFSKFIGMTVVALMGIYLYLRIFGYKSKKK